MFNDFNDCLVLDHIVPSSTAKTKRGYRYILTLTDGWSDYTLAIPVKTQTASESIAQLRKSWIYIFGMPREIIVDNHPSFTSEFFGEFFETFGSKVTKGTSYSCSSTSRAEKSNKRVNAALRSVLVDGNEMDWDLYCAPINLALNSSVNKRTGFSRNKMAFNREINMPLSIMLEDEDPPIKEGISKSVAEKMWEMHEEMKRVMAKAQKNTGQDFAYAKKYHDRNLKGPFFEVGDECYVMKDVVKHKFQSKWDGPHLIERKINDHLYVVAGKVKNIGKLKWGTPRNHPSRKPLQEDPEKDPDNPQPRKPAEEHHSSTNSDRGTEDTPVAYSEDSSSNDSSISPYLPRSGRVKGSVPGIGIQVESECESQENSENPQEYSTSPRYPSKTPKIFRERGSTQSNLG